MDNDQNRFYEIFFFPFFFLLKKLGKMYDFCLNTGRGLSDLKGTDKEKTEVRRESGLESTVVALYDPLWKMENNAFKDRNFGDNEHEEIPDSFCCCVCFLWSHAVSGVSINQWIVCASHSVQYVGINTITSQQSAKHFIFLLLKIYPVAYNRTRDQTLAVIWCKMLLIVPNKCLREYISVLQG